MTLVRVVGRLVRGEVGERPDLVFPAVDSDHPVEQSGCGARRRDECIALGRTAAAADQAGDVLAVDDDVTRAGPRCRPCPGRRTTAGP